jgi:hypothetical protein
MSKKLIVSIPSIKSEDYINLENACKQTWLNYNNQDVKHLFYYGSNEDKFKENELYVKCNNQTSKTESNKFVGQHPIIIEKTIKMFEFALKNYNFEFMFRTNLSSYLDLNLLLKYIDKIESRNCYMGYIGYHEQIVFASGAGILLSRDMVDLLVNKQNMIDQNLIDDVAFAKLFYDLKINPKPLPRFTFPMCTNQDNQFFSQIKQSKHFHFRVKTNDSTRKNDCERLRLIHKSKTK